METGLLLPECSLRQNSWDRLCLQKYCIAQGEKKEGTTVCRSYIKITLKCIPVYIRCRQILRNSTYMRYLEVSNS